MVWHLFFWNHLNQTGTWPQVPSSTDLSFLILLEKLLELGIKRFEISHSASGIWIGGLKRGVCIRVGGGARMRGFWWQPKIELGSQTARVEMDTCSKARYVQTVCMVRYDIWRYIGGVGLLYQCSV